MAFIVLKFAKIKNYKVDDIFLNKINDAFKKYGIKNKSPKRLGFKFSQKENGYVSVRFVKEIERKIPILDSKNEEIETEINPAFGKKIFIFRDGCIAYETSKQIFTSDIFNTIVEAWDKIKEPKEEHLEIEKIEVIDSKTLKLFYKESKAVLALKLREIGEKQPNPRIPPKVIKDIVYDARDKTESIELKGKIIGAKTEGNLKDVQVFNEGFVPLSELEEVRGKDTEDFKFTVSKTGKITSGLPEDPIKQKNKIIELCRKVFKFLPQSTSS